jgi:predicted homoserine dehydrogenase-like protein
MYKPYHAIGLELGITVASIGLRGEPTGQPVAWNADVVATTKRALAAGELLDGEGGFTVYGSLRPAHASRGENGLPLGLAHGMKLKHATRAHQRLRWEDVAYDESMPAIAFRREMEKMFARQ